MDVIIKSNIKTNDINDFNEYDGTFDNNRIEYKEDNVGVFIDLDNSFLVRENYTEGYKIELDFLNNICKIYIKESDSYLPLDIILDEFNHSNNKVNIRYRYSNDLENKFEYNIEYINK